MIFNLKEAQFLSELTKPLVSMVDKLDTIKKFEEERQND